MEKKDYLTIKEVAKLLNVSYLTIYYWLKKGILKKIQVVKKGKILIERSELEKLKK